MININCIDLLHYPGRYHVMKLEKRISGTIFEVRELHVHVLTLKLQKKFTN